MFEQLRRQQQFARRKQPAADQSAYEMNSQAEPQPTTFYMTHPLSLKSLPMSLGSTPFFDGALTVLLWDIEE